MKKYIFALLAVISLSANAGTTETVGKVRGMTGDVTIYKNTSDSGVDSYGLSASDKYGIRNVIIIMTKGDMDELIQVMQEAKK